MMKYGSLTRHNNTKQQIMKTRKTNVHKFLAYFILISFAFYAASCSSGKPERVLFIALDGISIEGYQTAKTPNIDKLMQKGSFSLKTRVVMPSVTLPNWTSHLTGSGPEQHGVTDNGWLIDNHVLPAVDTDDKGYYPSIFKILKDQVPGVRTAFYYNWANLIYPYNRDYLDEVRFQENYEYIENFERAFEFIRENREKPTFVFLYTVHTDGAGHSHGWMSPEYIESIENADFHIGALLDKMEKEGMLEDTHIIVTSDHGGVNKGHGGVTPTEMEVPWSLTGPGVKKNNKITGPNNTVNSAFVVAHLFKCSTPESWTGRMIHSIFE
jgi:predicted AlkP superfamily pyrophosphatase or phosphodiesterase